MLYRVSEFRIGTETGGIMFEKLVESMDSGKHKRKLRTLFATIGTAITGLFLTGLVVSIFSTNLAMGSEAIDLSRLVAPATLAESAPPQPESQARDNTVPEAANSRLPQRVQNMQRPDEVPVRMPTGVSTTPNKHRARPPGLFELNSAGDSDGAPGPGLNGFDRRGGADTAGSGFNTAKPDTDKTDRNPVDVKIPVAPPPLTPKKMLAVTGGVVNGRAIDLVKPVRSASAISVGAKGAVSVNVVISETGKVETASASNGHPLLRNAAVMAALRSTFHPTTLSNQPVKVKGVIVYNFN